jgi:hypothetical protein
MKQGSYTYGYLKVNPHVYAMLSIYAFYITFKWMSHFLDNRHSSTESNERVFVLVAAIFNHKAFEVRWQVSEDSVHALCWHCIGL